ncbi:phage tail tape measure protein [Roseibium aestuarii]|uniref:Phage tail tape measure protein n=1 Tax=Roseibium aestuarii TaxID=2600299 RepID=A0ABW4JTH9_9HYPH|nr:phage tail tape measure protein [Roseibium aestuarii]
MTDHDDQSLGAGTRLPLDDLREFDRQMVAISARAERFSLNLSGGMKAALVDGRSLEQVMSRLALSLSGKVLTSALAPLDGLVTSALGGLTKGLGSSLSSGLSGLLGQVTPFARGGVVGAPALFANWGGGGLGLAGEAGPEAILPLARGLDGRLGVRTGAGSGGSVTINVVTRDAESFSRSQAQVSAMVARAVGRGRRGL